MLKALPNLCACADRRHLTLHLVTDILLPEVRPHYAVILSGRRTLELGNPQYSPETVCDLLLHLNGVERFSLVLFGIPGSKSLDEIPREQWGLEYLQCAGSAEAMTVETRVLEDGEYRQYVLGRGDADHSAEPSVTIPWDQFTVSVLDDEVFTAEEASPLFISYLETGAPPSTVSLRRREL